MKPDEIQSIVKEKWDQLPESVRSALSNFNWKDPLLAIGKKYNLQIDDLNVLQNETMMILLGITPPDELKKQMAEQTQLPEVQIQELSDDVEKEVFRKIREAVLTSSKDEEEIPEGEGEILSSIENPPASKPVSFAETKIREPHGLKEATQGDSDIPTPPEARGVDPYREEI